MLSLFVPDMVEYDEPPKVVAGNIVAQTSQVKDIISAVSACFVSAGGSDLIKPKYLSLKPERSSAPHIVYNRQVSSERVSVPYPCHA